MDVQMHCCDMNVFQHLYNNKGFKINPCDHYIANKNISRQQCNIVSWYVGGNKISHIDHAVVVGQVIESIERKFGKMTADIGKNICTFVSMNIEYTENKEVKITMVDI